MKRFLLMSCLLFLIISFLSCAKSYTQTDIDASFKQGYDNGYSVGLKQGYSNSLEACKAQNELSTNTAKGESSESYDLGYKAGLADGYDNGLTDCIANVGESTLTNLFENMFPKNKYICDKNSKTYHYPWCKVALKIGWENMTPVNSTGYAKALGCTPCPICNPP